MPKLAAEKVKKLIMHLNKKWKNQVCPMCQVGQWNISDAIVELREYHGGNLVIGGPIVPVIIVTCTNCGNTILVNAIVAGIVEPEKGDENEPK